MQACNAIDGASFDPETLKALGQAFDEAWLVVGGNFSTAATEAGRVRLAKALLSVATEDGRDVEALKRGALEAMALTYYVHSRDRASH